MARKPKSAPDAAFGPSSWLRSRWIPFLLITAYALQALWHAADKSPTYDETGHVTASFLLARTQHQDFDVGHPPLLRRLFALPLLALRASFPTQSSPPYVPSSVPLPKRPSSEFFAYASFFLFGNRVPAESLIFWPRTVNVALGCLLGAWMYLWAGRLYGRAAGALALAFFAFCPNLIAHGSLVTTDLGGVAFAVGFLSAWDRLLLQPSPRNLLLAGTLLGCALGAKYTNVFLVPLFAAAHFFLQPERADRGIRRNLLAVSSVLALAWFWLCLFYKFENVFTPHLLQPEDWSSLQWGGFIPALYRHIPLPDSFLRGVCFAIYHDKRGHASFLLGEFSSGGWRSYFPLAFLLKTPLAALLALAGLAAACALRRLRLGRREALLLLPLMFLMATAFYAKINIGLRHILLAYPLLYVLLGKVLTLESFAGPSGDAAEKSARPPWKSRPALIVAMAAVFSGAETLASAPHYLAFFNRAAGGPEAGIRYLSDSNLDWGQDLRRLATYLKRQGDPEVLLSYFGTAPPQYYGIRYQALPTVWSFPGSDHVNSSAPGKELLAVSATCLQGTYFGRHDLYAWLLAKKPAAVIGHSIHVYDVTDDRDAQKRLLDIYTLAGDVSRMARQVERIRRMDAVGG